MAYRRDPRDQYYNNGSNGEYAGGYQRGQFTNPRMQNDGYRAPIRNPYATPNSNAKGQRAADDDDNESIGSSIYSQPSVSGNNRYYQGQSYETTEPNRQSLYNEYDYPPSPFAASTRNSAGLTAGSSQQGLIEKSENNYMPDNMDENYYQDYSQNPQSQFDDVYNDFNNNFQGDEKYGDEESRNNTLTGPGPNSYSLNDGDFSTNGKGGTRQSASAHYVVKKDRKCACCSRKTCVIITFIILILLGVGLYFVWPRFPGPATNVGNSEFTTSGQLGFKFDLDNTANWLPYKFNSLEIDVYNAANVVYNRPLATGVKKGFSIPGRAITTISVPLTISQDDLTLQNFTNSCTTPSDLQLTIGMTMSIFGIDWIKKPQASIPGLSFECPNTNTTNTQSTPVTAPTPGGGTTPAPSPTLAAASVPAPGGASPTPTGTITSTSAGTTSTGATSTGTSSTGTTPTGTTTSTDGATPTNRGGN